MCGPCLIPKTPLSVATWRPARCRITCPQCGERQYPTIRMTADRYSQSVYGATWIMTCWPFCFLPCLFTAPTKHHLHCSKCGAFLGLYNPNQEVVETNGRRRNASSSSSHGSQRKSNICEERTEMVWLYDWNSCVKENKWTCTLHRKKTCMRFLD